jgi:co-chaperonin GroES (HSP10)
MREIPENLRPIGGNVLVELLPESDRTPGGLHVPETARHKRPLARCKVLAVGDGYVTRRGVLVPPGVEPGDVVLMPWRVNADHGNRRRVVPSAELLAVVG